MHGQAVGKHVVAAKLVIGSVLCTVDQVLACSFRPSDHLVLQAGSFAFIHYLDAMF